MLKIDVTLPFFNSLKQKKSSKIMNSVDSDLILQIWMLIIALFLIIVFACVCNKEDTHETDAESPYEGMS